jgi:hypothetical protein
VLSQQQIVQQYVRRVAAAFGILTSARMVHVNSPDDLRTKREKV